jgi:outer membrane protein TolC
MHGGSTGWHRKSGFLFAKSAANRQKPVREALKPTADKPTMRASQRIILTITATSMLHAVNAADIEKQLPERWERNDREQGFMEDFQQDISRIPSKPRRFATTPAPERIPADFAPWWIRGQGSTIGSKTRGQGVSLENLYVRAIQNSNQIRVFSDLPLIRETGIQEAKGAFDTNSFVSAMFDRKNEPVGNTLTTGGANRFKQDEWSLEAGVRKKFVTGTEVTVSQRLARTDNNSIYFVPNPQARATLELNIVQPLLKGAGIGYNRSVLQIAKIDSEIAMAEFIRQSESHLQEIARAYWSLYAARVTYLQKLKLLEETGKLADEIKARVKLDAQSSQLFRAQSAVASRKADLIRAEAAIRNAQDRLRSLTNDPDLMRNADVELVPRDQLVLNGDFVDAQSAARVALETRPEINQAFMQLRAATVRAEMTKKELLPELNLVLKGALGGLSGGDYGTAWSREFNTGAPGWGAGLVFNYPIENNAAKARHERRLLELRQQINQVKTTVDSVILEVQISAREVATSYREALAKYSAVKAYAEDIATLEARRTVQPFSDPAVAAIMGPEATKTAQATQTTEYIDRMLDAQDRRAAAEEEFIRSAANYQVSLVNMQRAKGKLLRFEGIQIVRDRQDGLPLLYLQKGQGGGKDYKKIITSE